MTGSRHFTISDSDKSIRDAIQELRTRLSDEEGIELSQSKVIKWAVNNMLKNSKVR